MSSDPSPVPSSAVPSSALSLVLFALRVRLFAELDAVAERCRLEVAEAEATLHDAAASGLVHHRDGARPGWRLTPHGRTVGAARWRAEAVDGGQLPVITAQYEAFRALNRPFLEVCTAWQVRDLDAGIINDHSDPAHDAAVLDDLGELDAQVGPICDRLSASMQRYGWYRPRFAAALGRARLGEIDAVAAPLSDSFHTVWFELHEDLLVTLDIDRADERNRERIPT